MLKKFIWFSFFILNFWLGFASFGHGRVIVFDGVTTVKKPTYLKVLTKGRLFAQGGKLVDVYVDNKKVKQILTGGDGYGYLKYTPQRTGLTRIEARSMSESDSDSGVILVVAEGDKLILIEVENGLKESLLSQNARANSRKAIETLSQTYKIIYLNTSFAAGLSRNWLRDKEFVETATLKWQGSIMLKSLKEKGIHLFAIIGSAGLVAEATKYIENRYSFEETKDGQTVKDWEEILKLLEEASHKAPSNSTAKQK